MAFNLSVSWDFGQQKDDNNKYYDYFTNLKNINITWDIVQLSADFYLGFAIINKSLVKYPDIKILHPDDVIEAAKILDLTQEEINDRNRKYYTYISSSPNAKLKVLTDQFEIWYEDFTNKLDALFIDYASAAIGGELRHHQNVLDLGKGSSEEGRHKAWTQWGNIHKIHGDQIFETAEALFLDFPPGSYGGEPWANAANLLSKRKSCSLAGSLIENKTLFIDRVLNMQHNTGSFLNKVTWANFRTGDVDGVHNIHQTTLAAHGSNPPDLNLLVSKSSSFVKETVMNIIEIAKENNLEINGVINKEGDE
jgi:hypothetical protein